jgi:hypothetical protein
MEELLVAELVPQLAFEPAYRYEVLGGAGVFVRAARHDDQVVAVTNGIRTCRQR